MNYSYEKPWDLFPTITVHDVEKGSTATGILDADGRMLYRREPDFKFGFQPKLRVRVKAISGRTRA